ncbi:YxiG-like protein [Nocardioides kribbensis]|uniref:YxiG-like protein n=1 Tax=Nocardioides kribbensis TaxID=305517 RepID=UPI001D0CE9C1|nr:hypothetical protein [Nocardioides kribbensis]
MNRDEMKQAMDDVFDQAVVFHGFADYMRDYDVVMWATADPRSDIAPERLVYTFKHCVRATVTSAVPPEVWARSLDDRLMDYETGVELDGYVWGVKSQELYPGMQFVSPSSDASHWESALGVPFYEVSIKMNGHNINLVFSDLAVRQVAAGCAPSTVPPGGPDWKIPLT